ncbi:unnamed protein product, partial [Leptidea sinapis]
MYSTSCENDKEEPSSSSEAQCSNSACTEAGPSGKPPAKRRLSNTVIEISDTDSDDSDVCAVKSYQASADEVKRIRKADYSSSSSTSDYTSDSNDPWEDDAIVIYEKKETIVSKAHLNPRAERHARPRINQSILAQELIGRISTSWSEKSDHKCDKVTLTCKPFRVCLMHNLLSNPEIINNIVDDMNTLDWTRKKMDLYEFHQTTDLANLTWQRSIGGIYELLKTDIKSWVSQVTGLDLKSVSASCSLYGPGDHLLVHDDRLSDRRVAFILYLAPWQQPIKHALLQNGGGDTQKNEKESTWCGWSPEMGGGLELFSMDQDGEPATVEHTVYPANNMLAFFQVGPETYHQVSEVLSMELPRLSINGWFHGPGVKSEPPMSTPPVKHRAHSQVV